MREEEDPWRERGRAVLVGLILALGVVAMVLLGRRGDPPAEEWPPIAGVYEVVAECEGCGCEPTEAEGLAIIHPGLPPGRPTPKVCGSPEGCAALLARRAPPDVRAPVVLAPDADPALVRRELSHGPPLAADGETFVATVARERREPDGCVRVRRSRELVPEGADGWRWTERYESGAGADCPSEERLSCATAVVRRIRRLGM